MDLVNNIQHGKKFNFKCKKIKMQKLNVNELSKLLETQIKQSSPKEVSLTETGKVLTIGDGIARIYGLKMWKLVRWWNFLQELKEWHLI